MKKRHWKYALTRIHTAGLIVAAVVLVGGVLKGAFETKTLVASAFCAVLAACLFNYDSERGP